MAVTGGPGGQGRWLFSARVDLAVFLGSAVVALGLLAVGWAAGFLRSDTPEWTWIAAVLLIDVAHVWSTVFRVYLDGAEFRRRPWLYALVPVFAWVVGVALYSESPLLFWRVLAYMAVFHFVRQQYGWVALYRARVGERDGIGRWLDTAAIYAATLFPLLYWHAHLPRSFWWFLPGDFAAIPQVVARVAEPVYWAVLAAWTLRAGRAWIHQFRRRRAAASPVKPGEDAPLFNPGKDIVVVTTAVCWYAGIVALGSDYAFTVTNVIIHGVPYMALVYWYGKRRLAAGGGGGMRVLSRGPWLFVAILWVAAYAEELLWDRALWHERAWLFGDGWGLEGVHVVLVPLLAVPQATHYILDGFVWRRQHNPGFARAAGLAGGDAAGPDGELGARAHRG